VAVLEFDAEAVRQFCQERGIARLELFGSALRDDFDLDSDVDEAFWDTAQQDLPALILCLEAHLAQELPPALP
jgi:predicted nucleotidyltransferase